MKVTLEELTQLSHQLREEYEDWNAKHEKYVNRDRHSDPPVEEQVSQIRKAQAKMQDTERRIVAMVLTLSDPEELVVMEEQSGQG